MASVSNEKDEFERLVEAEMMRQMDAVKSARLARESELNLDRSTLLPERRENNQSKEEQHSPKLGFGRGLHSLQYGFASNDEIMTVRQLDIQKKLAYQRELDTQLEEKKIEEAKQKRGSERELIRTLESPGGERIEPPYFEKENSSPIHSNSSREDKLNKQRQVQQALESQIEERKRLKEDERRKRAEMDAMEEARIQRDLEELRLAYERENTIAVFRPPPLDTRPPIVPSFDRNSPMASSVSDYLKSSRISPTTSSVNPASNDIAGLEDDGELMELPSASKLVRINTLEQTWRPTAALNVSLDKSLACASRYFVYVSQKNADDSDDEDEALLLNDLERSRVRTAEAARMALDRACSSNSDDGEYQQDAEFTSNGKKRWDKKIFEPFKVHQNNINEDDDYVVYASSNEDAESTVSDEYLEEDY